MIPTIVRTPTAKVTTSRPLPPVHWTTRLARTPTTKVAGSESAAPIQNFAVFDLPRATGGGYAHGPG